jgi:hypothetical protein
MSPRPQLAGLVTMESNKAGAGTVAALVRATAVDILSDGAPHSPVQITTEYGAVVTGTLTAVDELALSVEPSYTAARPRRIAIAEAKAFRF